MKVHVYDAFVDSKEDLFARICVAAVAVQERSVIFQNVHDSVTMPGFIAAGG